MSFLVEMLSDPSRENSPKKQVHTWKDRYPSVYMYRMKNDRINTEIVTFVSVNYSEFDCKYALNAHFLLV